MPRPRAPASKPRSCASSSACAKWTRTISTSRKPCSTSTSAQSECCRPKTRRRNRVLLRRLLLRPANPPEGGHQRVGFVGRAVEAADEAGEGGAATVKLEAVVFEGVHRARREVEEELVGLDRGDQAETGQPVDPRGDTS